ncbi:MAG: winged helix-turn-helix transcriptional regulator [Nitrosopumilus sp.]|nr:winged helix-turn-helix transcriptional regulator [Nitrosopumilus sp.]MDH3736105.1 winged helix-turn-helix transcriptional regulator [Nitrosopumilus sp.]MDH3823029.1 winged helix-turn-helix transcriptional regulator [Nitrosopumilus sp.]MDH3834162.1 winged helix-turn-helix transcriptional regulator [Nitrosopumilus sp.]
MTERDSQIQQIIEQNPGIQFREIMRSSGLKNGVLSHYLGKLEKNGIIKVIRGPRQARFYPPRITEDESTVIKALRKQTPRDLLLALIKEDGLEFAQLVKEVKKSPSTVSLYLSQIVEDGLVEIRLVALKKRYHIKARDLMDKLIEDYRPSLLEKPTSGFEDIINSF